jgi:hypothetical protein
MKDDRRRDNDDDDDDDEMHCQRISVILDDD